jgi:hypothetical protein
MVDELITPAELARIRGVSASAVSQAMNTRIAEAIVIRNGKKMLRKNQALLLWEQRTPITQRNRKTAVPASVSEHGPPRLPTNEELRQVIANLPEDKIPPLNASQARKEHYQAERQRVAALRERREVGNIEEMRREASALGKALSDSILSVPGRIAGKAASMSDQHAIRDLFLNELKTALRALKSTAL